MYAELKITLYSFMAVLTIAVQGYAQPQYTITDLGPFIPSAIAGPWIVGSENGLPVRLNLDTGHKEILAHYGHGGGARDVIPDGAIVGTVKWPDSQGVLQDVATFWSPDGGVPTVLFYENRPGNMQALTRQSPENRYHAR